MQPILLLFIRIYLFLPFWFDGMQRWLNLHQTQAWFALPAAQGGLGLPMPLLLTQLLIGAELCGALCLLFGLFTRGVAIGLMSILLLAIILVHWQMGWGELNQSTNALLVLQQFNDWLLQTAPDWTKALKPYGELAFMQNGMEKAVGYFLLCAVLVWHGAGNYVSLDFYLKYFFKKESEEKPK